MSIDKIIDALANGEDWRVVAASIGLGVFVAFVIYKRQIETLNERLKQRDDKIKDLEEKVKDIQSGKAGIDLSPDEVAALRHIRNWQEKNPHLNFWEQHTSPKSLSQWMAIDWGHADDIIQELKAKNLVTAEAFKGTYPDPNTPINFSHPVMLTTKGHKILEKYSQ